MSQQNFTDPMLDMFLFETTQNLEQLESIILESDKTSCYAPDAINEIFRIMHTIKGSSALMLFNGISALAHSIEDMFYFLREKKPQKVDCPSLSDLVLEGLDFIKTEIEKIISGDNADRTADALINRIREFLSVLKQDDPLKTNNSKADSEIRQQYYIIPDKQEKISNCFRATIFFEDGCEMENIRAYTVIHNIRESAREVFFLPEDIIEDTGSVQEIRDHGFKVYLKTASSYDEIYKSLMETVFLRELELVSLQNDDEFRQFFKPRPEKLSLEPISVKIPAIDSMESKPAGNKEQAESQSAAQNIISVNVEKLDKLMDLMGEIVIAEAMVTGNPVIQGLNLDSFQKAARQLQKITGDLQDIVMSIRMVSLSPTFRKMDRVVRDMGRKLGKQVNLKLIGEGTEVDKKIIEHISDPLMHLVRNSIDHGIEDAEERENSGKPKEGAITIEAKNEGSDVHIIVRDDGRGLSKTKILSTARERNLIAKPEQDLTDREIFNLIFLPGFSTKESVSEFSGRGVGMDVVVKNIEAVGGSVSVDSNEGSGSVVTLKIPLTLAIIDGMNISVGNSSYTIPTTSIKESFRPRGKDLVCDPDGNEMIMVRGKCYPILRLHRIFKVDTNTTDFTKGILIMVELGDKTLCVFADHLLGQQQVVVKALPDYIKNLGKIKGLSGCTLLGDGSISLILDVAGLLDYSQSC